MRPAFIALVAAASYPDVHCARHCSFMQQYTLPKM